MSTNVKYFSGTQELKNAYSMKNAEFAARFPGVKGVRYCPSTMWIAHTMTGPNVIMPVTKIIYYKKNPSLHKCDARCQSAKGPNCECQCGGQFHGGN